MGRKKIYTDEERKARRAEYMKQWREEHKAEIAEYYKEYGREYYQTHKEEIDERHKDYYQANKEEIVEQMKKYHKQYYNTPFGRTYNLVKNYRYSDKKHNRGECTITAEWMVDNVCSGQKCFYCGESDWTKLGLDRIDNSLPHTPDNVVVCCEECNKKRGKKSFEEFCKEMGVTKKMRY